MKILSWNIQNFTQSRIVDPLNPRADEHFNYITTTISELDPDVVVILEARCTHGAQAGVLATGEGVTGLETLLAWLQKRDTWWLVPPLRVNPQALAGALPLPTRSESVGVFWRGDRLTFQGPWIWPASKAQGPPVEPGSDMAAAYPANIDGVLVPDGTNVAPRLEWIDPDTKKQIYFTEQHDRRPFQVTFTESKGDKRTINLLAVHPSPARAIKALRPFRKLLWGDAWPKPGQLTVLAGDINVNLLSARADRMAAVNKLEERGLYSRLPPNPLVGTMLLRNSAAVPTKYNTNRCVDYGWVRYARTARRPAGGPAAIAVDRVAGAAAKGPFPAITSRMARSLDYLAAIGDANHRNTVFRFDWNYGHIGPPAEGTSDHLPVLLYV